MIQSTYSANTFLAAGAGKGLTELQMSTVLEAVEKREAEGEDSCCDADEINEGFQNGDEKVPNITDYLY